jgi:putative oxidoreductase
VAYGLLFLRVVTGATMFGHGAQKLFGWWGGPGLPGIRGWLESMGFRMPAAMALLVALSETGGLLFALGLVTPFAAFGIAAGMVVAVGSVHWKNGFWNGNQGFEFNLLLFAVAVAVAATGPGRFSLDRLLRLDDNWSGLWWGVGAAVAALAAGGFILTALRTRPPVQEPAA